MNRSILGVNCLLGSLLFLSAATLTVVAATPNDPRFPDQWSLLNTGDNAGPLQATQGADISAVAAWNVFTGSRDVIVAISDNAFDGGGHIDLVGNLLDEIVSTQTGHDDAEDIWNIRRERLAYHGTAIAGIIGAVANNGIGMAGINWEVSLLPVRSSTLIYTRIQTIIDAADAGAHIINVSWDLPYTAPQEYLDALWDACLYALDHDLLIVCSAGNNGIDVDERPEYPCCYDLPNLICVTATRPDDSQIYNYGEESVHLAAPGVRILVPAHGNGYEYVSGTSFATPMVAGVAALVKGRFPALGAAEVKARILDAVDPLPELADKVISGGRLNAFKAVAEPDASPPAAVDDLTIYDAAYTSLFVKWIATGDDGLSGQAAAYDLRYATETIDEGNFASATPVSGLPAPAAPGTVQKTQATSLESGVTYYFAIKVLDEWGAYGEPGNISPLSNVASGRTRHITDRSAGGSTVLGSVPNPFHPGTSILFALERTGRTEIHIYDLRGRLVRRLDAGTSMPGEHVLTWDGRSKEGGPAPSGVYYYQLFLDGRGVGRTEKAILLK